ncbi:hypothetical protein SAMN05660745_02418 [Corynebacterium glucuronolyticum]|nr:hypothetical protein SAMN05660745_01991 [Corynebacterium glucuronolyticum]SMB80390.1 hypothetical protein SAMN05660745_02418 [Corynebacterium glucuronolyticum]
MGVLFFIYLFVVGVSRRCGVSDIA